jgi:putative effector of murein hydrolase LrgA (UPF0299 family)
MSFHDVWVSRSPFSRVLFIISILYFIAAAIALPIVLGLIDVMQEEHERLYILILFAIVSFALALVICACHLSTQIRRRKRKTDV